MHVFQVSHGTLEIRARASPALAKGPLHPTVRLSGSLLAQRTVQTAHHSGLKATQALSDPWLHALELRQIKQRCDEQLVRARRCFDIMIEA